MKPTCEIFIRYLTGEYDSVKIEVPIVNGKADLSKAPVKLRGQGYKILSHRVLEQVEPAPTLSPVSQVDLKALQQKFNN